MQPLFSLAGKLRVCSKTAAVAGHVRLVLYVALGWWVAVLVDAVQGPGRPQVRLEAVDLPAGVYLYPLQAGESVQARKLLLLK